MGFRRRVASDFEAWLPAAFSQEPAFLLAILSLLLAANDDTLWPVTQGCCNSDVLDPLQQSLSNPSRVSHFSVQSTTLLSHHLMSVACYLNDSVIRLQVGINSGVASGSGRQLSSICPSNSGLKTLPGRQLHVGV